MHQWHRVVPRPGAYGADISTGSCHDPVPMLALDIGTGANDHPVPQAGLPLLDISKCLTTPHSYLYPSHFSTSHLSLPYPLSLKKPGVRAASRWPLPRSARSCRACGQLAAGRCRGAPASCWAPRGSSSPTRPPPCTGATRTTSTTRSSGAGTWTRSTAWSSSGPSRRRPEALLLQKSLVVRLQRSANKVDFSAVCRCRRFAKEEFW